MIAHLHTLDAIPRHALPFGSIRVLAGERLMMFWSELDAGTHAALHAHDNEQITWLISGSMEVRVGDGPLQQCGAGTVLVVPANVMHESRCIEKCELVEVFNPPRLDMFPAAATHPYGLP